MKIIINENQKGLLFKNGCYTKLLSKGRYRVYGDKWIEVLPLNKALTSHSCSLDTLLADSDISKATNVIEVKDACLALHYVNGLFSEVLTSGKYAYWNTVDKHEFTVIDICAPDVSEDIPTYILAKLPDELCLKISVEAYQKALVFYNNKLMHTLESGIYYFWKTETEVTYILVDTRLIQKEITGQEIMTQDKVSLRVNFVCSYHLADYIRAYTELDNYTEHIHVFCQLALREYIGTQSLDSILTNKEEISKYVYSRLKEKESELFVEFTAAGVRDIILPGEIRDIMNTVLSAEKKAQANVITRREEVASTRSLLNTAKLMEENKTLQRLKELEYLERICQNVGSINFSGSGDVLTQLLNMLSANKSS